MDSNLHGLCDVFLDSDLDRHLYLDGAFQYADFFYDRYCDIYTDADRKLHLNDCIYDDSDISMDSDLHGVRYVFLDIELDSHFD